MAENSLMSLTLRGGVYTPSPWRFMIASTSKGAWEWCCVTSALLAGIPPQGPGWEEVQAVTPAEPACRSSSSRLRWGRLQTPVIQVFPVDIAERRVLLKGPLQIPDLQFADSYLQLMAVNRLATAGLQRVDQSCHGWGRMSKFITDSLNRTLLSTWVIRFSSPYSEGVPSLSATQLSISTWRHPLLPMSQWASPKQRKRIFFKMSIAIPFPT